MADKDPPAMSAEDFNAWLDEMGWSDAEARRRLGIGSHNTILAYKREGAPMLVALACNALLHRLGPWQRAE